jgi:N-acetyl-anhydromuramyl-L-alanine amidase AmpD
MTLVLPAQALGDVEGVPYREAKNYTRAERKLGDVLWVVVHTAECAEVRHAAENVAWWFAGQNAPRVSYHYTVDSDSVVQSVLEKHVAWQAAGGNRFGIGVGHAGRAKQITEDWQDYYSRATLIRSAELVAGICRRWQIPVLRIGPAELQAWSPGICGHHDVSLAFGKSTHVDPGKHFPWDEYFEEIHRIFREESTLPPPSDVPSTPRNC